MQQGRGFLPHFLLSVEVYMSVLTFSSRKLFSKTYFSAKLVLLSVNGQRGLGAALGAALKVKPVF